MKNSAAEITNRSSDSRERILDAAEKLFRQLSYPGLRMKSISDYLGISRKTLYNHFPGGKRDLWRNCVERQMREFALRLSSVVEDTDSDYVNRGGRILEIGRDVVEQFYGPEGLLSSREEKDLFSPELIKSYNQSLIRFFKEGVENGLLRSNLPVVSLSAVVITLITAWGEKDSMLKEGELKSLPEFFEQVMFNGILSEEGRQEVKRLYE